MMMDTKLGNDGAAAADFVKAMTVKYAGDKSVTDHVAGYAYAAVENFVDKHKGFSQAIAWIESLPDGPPRGAAAVILIDRWITLDPEAASAWVNALPPGDTREDATRRSVLELFEEDPTCAFEWAKTLVNENERRAKLRRVFDSWLKKDSSQAIEAVHTLPDAELVRLFKSRECSA